MYVKIEKPKETKSRVIANAVGQKRSNAGQSFEFVDRRAKNSLQRKVIQLAAYYAYGDADSTPHVHCYSGGDGHLKILDRSRIRRYNIVQNGQVHAQAGSALEAAQGNEVLLGVIQALINAAGGGGNISSSDDSGSDSEPDDFSSTQEMWKHIGQANKAKRK